MISKKQGKERRIHKRFNVDGLNGKMLMASEVTIENLSLGGASIEIDRRLEKGREYSLRIGDRNNDILVSGKVVRSSLLRFKKNEENESTGVYRVAMQFKNVISEKSFQLLQFITEHAADDERRVSGQRITISHDNAATLKCNVDYEVKKISLGGMLIRTTRPLQVEEIYPMDVEINGKEISFDGSVRSCLVVGNQENKNKKFDVGIAFVNLTGDNKKIIGEFIQSL